MDLVSESPLMLDECAVLILALGRRTIPVPKKTFTFYLAKPNVKQFEDLLSDNAKERLRNDRAQIVPVPGFGDGAKLFVFVGVTSTPNWYKDLDNYFDIPGDPIKTTSACAVLAFSSGEQTFAATFSHGWSYLNQEKIEGDFGLRVALNALNPDKLKRLDRINLADSLRGVDLSSFQRDFKSFPVEETLNLVRKISGNTRDDSSAENISGAQSVKMFGEYSIADLPEIAEEAMELFNSTYYQKTVFEIIDDVQPIADRQLINELDQSAVESIQSKREDFELMLPNILEHEPVAFAFKGPRLKRHLPDLTLKQYVDALGAGLERIDRDTLKKHKIIAFYEEGDAKNDSLSIRSALLGTIDYKEHLYAINEGQWYRLDKAFKDGIEINFERLRQGWEQPPEPPMKLQAKGGRKNLKLEREFDYNKRVARKSGYIFLDSDLANDPETPRSQFEICDLLDIDAKRFIHVKRTPRRSSVISHFFKQGVNSARLFKVFPEVRTEIEKKVKKQENGDHNLKKWKASYEDDRKWAVEFWIIDAPRGDGSFNIPFFSKISLRDESNRLLSMEYDVALRFIKVEPEKIV